LTLHDTAPFNMLGLVGFRILSAKVVHLLSLFLLFGPLLILSLLPHLVEFLAVTSVFDFILS
jgi:hypothetical protein